MKQFKVQKRGLKQLYCGTGWGVCQALFLWRQTDAIQKGRGVGSGARFFKLAWQLDSRGVVQVLVFYSHGVKVRKQGLELGSVGAKVCWCGDTFHPPEKLTLSLKVTPFDSNTPTHQRSKVPIGGYLRRCSALKLPRSLIIICISFLPLTSSRLNANAS